MPEFAYKEYLDQYSDCPPSVYQEREISPVYRWVWKEINHENNFIPPKLRFSPENIDKPIDFCKLTCQHFGLSFFTEKDEALKRFKETYERKNNVVNNKRIKNAPGRTIIMETHLSEGKITRADGLVSDPEKNVHITLHKYKTNHLARNFKVIEPLSP